MDFVTPYLATHHDPTPSAFLHVFVSPPTVKISPPLLHRGISGRRAGLRWRSFTTVHTTYPFFCTLAFVYIQVRLYNTLFAYYYGATLCFLHVTTSTPLPVLTHITRCCREQAAPCPPPLHDGHHGCLINGGMLLCTPRSTLNYVCPGKAGCVTGVCLPCMRSQFPCVNEPSAGMATVRGTFGNGLR